MQFTRNIVRLIAVTLCVVSLASVSAFAANPKELDLYRYIGQKNSETIYGRVTDENGNPIVARVELWHAELGKVTEEMGEAVPESLQYVRNQFHADFSNDNGWYHVIAIPGEWMVRVTKGPEWEIKEFSVSVDDTELDGQRHDVTLKQLYDLSARGWFSGDTHHHSTHSDGRQPPYEVYESSIASGLDWCALTDHNTVDQNEEWVEFTSDDFLAVSGMEVTTNALPEDEEKKKGYGHQNALGVMDLPNPIDPENPVIWNRYMYDSWEDIQKAIDETHEMGGLYMINHAMQSRDWADGTFSFWGKVKNFDAIEVWNGEDPPHYPSIRTFHPTRTYYWNTNTMNTQVWFEFLNAGNKVAGWASSDSHDVYGLSYGTGPVYNKAITGFGSTYVKSNKLTWPAVRDALKKGNVFMSAGYWGPLLLVDSKGKIPGEEVEVGADGVVPLHIEVLSNHPLKGYAEGIRVIQGGTVIKTIPTADGKMTMDIETEVTIDPSQDTWLIVEVFNDYPAVAITNPLYLDVEPYGKWGATEWTFPQNAEKWMNPWPIHPPITVADGPSVPSVETPATEVGYGRPANAEALISEVLGLDPEEYRGNFLE
jgi:hypothetical protein